MEILRVLGLVGQVLFSLAAVLLFCLVVRTYLVGPYCRRLHVEGKGNKEVLILGISAFTFLMLTVRPQMPATYIACLIPCSPRACDRSFFFHLTNRWHT